MVEPLDSDEITSHHKKDNIRTIHFRIEKICGQIKNRTCTHGRKNHPYISDDESSFPTVFTEVLVTTLVTNSHKGRGITTVDEIVIYLNTLMDY